MISRDLSDAPLLGEVGGDRNGFPHHRHRESIAHSIKSDDAHMQTGVIETDGVGCCGGDERQTWTDCCEAEECPSCDFAEIHEA